MSSSPQPSSVPDVRDYPRPALPPRPADAHKGTFGRVLLIGGSVGMSGSITLSARAALRSGSGLVTAAVPRSIQPIVAACEPSYMTIGLPCDIDGGLHAACVEELLQVVTGMDAVGIGPGLGQSDPARQLVSQLLTTCTCPMVLDADALNILAVHGLPPAAERTAACVLTPHPGEFARLTGKPLPHTAAERESQAVEWARTHGVTLILKGHQTLVAAGDCLYRNTTGNSGMATGGSGDVLTGIVTSLLGQHLSPLDAAALGVHVHGLAGDLAAAELSQRGLIAADLPDFLNRVWRVLEAAQVP